MAMGKIFKEITCFLPQFFVMPFFYFSRSVCRVRETYSFAIFGFSFGWCELQMCMAFSVGLML